MNKKLYPYLLLLFFISLYIIPLGARDLIVPDEERYAEIPREMIATGDWIVPHFNGLRYFEKPVLGYWVHAGAMLIFGENNFAVRLPSALSVGLSALLIYLLIFKVLKNREKERNPKSIIAVFIFLTCFEVFAIGNAAVLDNLFSFFLTAAIISFYFACESSKRSGKEKSFLLISGIACGLAFLTKGFLAFAIPVLVLVPYLLWQKRYLDLIRMSWLPILIAIIVALPWSILIHLKEPDYWRFFFWNEHIRRFFDSDAQHGYPVWYFFVMAPGIFLVWVPLIPSSIIGIKEQLKIKNKESDLLKLSICWFVFPFLFFSISHGKLLTYVLPCFPPFAILMAFGLLHIAKSKRQNIFFQRGIIGNLILFTLLLIIFLFIQFFGLRGVQPFSQSWKIVMAINAFLFIILFCYLAFNNHLRTKKIILYGFSPFLLFLCINFLMPDPAMVKKMPEILLENYSQSIAKDTLIISDNHTAGAVCWYFKRNDVYILGRPGEFDYGLTYTDSKTRRIDIKKTIELIKNNPGKVLVIFRAGKIKYLKSQLPEPLFQDNSGADGYFLFKY